MTRDKKVLYAISFIIFAVLLALLFLNVGSSKIVVACILLPCTVFTCLLIKKRTSLSINKREVFLISSIMAVLYVVLLEISGLFFGFYGNPYFVTTETFFTTVLPIAAIIVETEIIRYVLLMQKNKSISAVSFMICVFSEVLGSTNIVGITSFNRFMDLVGLTLFPAISANIYYHYVSKSYGASPNIAFRLISTLYIYFLPTTIGITDSLLSCIKILLPLILLALTNALFEKKKKDAIVKGKKASLIGTAVAVAVVISTAMLISCQFRFGALVIATESMTGEINKGDMIIYERYDDQPIKEGQVIVFLQNESKIVHRVVKIENIGGELRYYTKGDANEDIDSGYRTVPDIFGVSDAKISYIGYPTLWLRELLSGSK